jgi:hypothetical protein
MVGLRRNQIVSKVDFIERIHFIILIIIRVFLAIAIFSALYTQRWTVFFVSIVTFLLTYLPHLFEKKYDIDIPAEFEIVTILFIFATLFLGEVRGFYTRFWWWDVILHTGSAIAFGFIGFTILYILYRGDKIKASPIIIAIFSFFFALGIGSIWEIFEFSMDQVFDLNMQKNGLMDTMWDLIVDSLGALFASICGYLYMKKREVFIFDKMIKKFVDNNPSLFGEN